jgi:hypothetical protein
MLQALRPLRWLWCLCIDEQLLADAARLSPTFASSRHEVDVESGNIESPFYAQLIMKQPAYQVINGMITHRQSP